MDGDKLKYRKVKNLDIISLRGCTINDIERFVISPEGPRGRFDGLEDGDFTSMKSSALKSMKMTSSGRLRKFCNQEPRCLGGQT